MSGERPIAIEPFLVVFAGLIVARLAVPARNTVLVDLLLGATLLAGGLGKPFAARRRWWLTAAGALALVVVAADAWLRP